MIARTVVATIEMRIAPLTLRTHRMTTSTRPSTKTKVGHPLSEAVGAELTGTGPVAGAPHEAGVDEADQGDEQADADRDGDLELGRHGVEHGRAGSR
jgi:hypothetical protein